MRAGYAALISAALTALVLIAALPHVPALSTLIPKATTTRTATLTQTLTTTAWKTTTKTKTQTLTQTETQTKTTTETQTTTAWKTKTQTTTETTTLTTTTTTTQTTTTTATVTRTVTKTVITGTFQYLAKPDKAIQLITKANKTVIVYIPYPLLGFLPHKFSPTVGKILNTTLQAYEQHKIDTYVVIAYNPICLIEVNKTFIKYLNRLNATLPPKHVLEMKNEDLLSIFTYPFQKHFLAIIMVDFKYMVLIEPGLHPPTNDTQHTYIFYNPQAINETMSFALKILRNFDNPNFDNGVWRYYIWVWDGCKKHETW